MTESVVTSENPGAVGIGVAAVGGGGIGTLLVGLAQFLPEGDRWRGFIVLVAPALSVALSSLWIWATAQVQRRLNERLADRTVGEMRDYLNSRIADRNTPSEMKALYQEQLVELERAIFDSRIKVVAKP